MSEPGGDWARTVAMLECDGFIKNAVEVLPLVYLVDGAEHGWSAVARECADRHGGTHLPLNAGLRYGMGSQLGGLIYDREYWPLVLTAREITRALVGPDELPVTVGGCIKKCLLNVTPARFPEKNAERLLIYDTCVLADNGLPYQYHDCLPGKYPNLVQWDCTGFYYQLLCRLPSLKLTVFADGLHFDPWTPEEAAKWRDLLQAVAGHKTLRNAVYGTSLGTDAASRRNVYHKDTHPFLREWPDELRLKKKRWRYTSEPNPNFGKVKASPMSLGPGPFRPAAQLIARTGYELCCAESHACNSVYSTVDSVTVRPGDKPHIWLEFGIAHDIARTKAGKQVAGAGEIVARGVWKVGPKQTIWYKAGNRQPIPAQRRNLPTHLFTNDWLRS